MYVTVFCVYIYTYISTMYIPLIRAMLTGINLLAYSKQKSHIIFLIRSTFPDDDDDVYLRLQQGKGYIIYVSYLKHINTTIISLYATT
jgi:hypothetical protein